MDECDSSDGIAWQSCLQVPCNLGHIWQTFGQAVHRMADQYDLCQILYCRAILNRLALAPCQSVVEMLAASSTTEINGHYSSHASDDSLANQMPFAKVMVIAMVLRHDRISNHGSSVAMTGNNGSCDFHLQPVPAWQKPDGNTVAIC
ncbi:hypothetical protein [Escherichia coli]|uniref:hypothetical protein n=1 Tax=Escherichia coli TaxID=562 RepID=UPI000810CD56|nr:hypothetical protein [Escherichia coli]ANW32361.1 hypothetical protein BB405_26355 [Escherichia coli]